MVLEVTEDLIKIQFKEAGYIKEHSPVRIISSRLSALPVLRDEDVQDI
jgi:hypothetical protein